MGFSIAIIAFDLKDAPNVLQKMDWAVTVDRVGVPVSNDNLIEHLLDPDAARKNNPHFSAGRNGRYLFIYLLLNELGVFIEPDYQLLSEIAPLIAYVVVETSGASSIEHWKDGKRVWSVGGASGEGFEVDGDPPIDMDALARDYRARSVVSSRLDPNDRLPEANSDLITERFSELLDAYFSEQTGFTYAGEHPDLFRIVGHLPTRDLRIDRDR